MLLGLLWLAILVVDAIVYSIAVGPQQGGPTPAGFAAVALASGQVSLTTVLASLLRGHPVLRFAFPWVFIIATILALVDIPGAGPITDMFNIFLLQMAAIAAPLLIGRLYGIHLGRADSSPATTEAAPMQFSLRQLLIVTTLAAVVMACCRDFRFESSNWKAILFVGVAFAAQSLIAIWTAFGRERWWLRVAVLLALPALFCYGVASALFIDNLNQHNLTIVMTLQTVFVAGCLAVYRIAGWRLLRTAA